jgi:hypothetical protein
LEKKGHKVKLLNGDEDEPPQKKRTKKEVEDGSFKKAPKTEPELTPQEEF